MRASLRRALLRLAGARTAVRDLAQVPPSTVVGDPSRWRAASGMAESMSADTIARPLRDDGSQPQIRHRRIPGVLLAQLLELLSEAPEQDRLQPGERGVDIIVSRDTARSYPANLVDVPLENHLKNYARVHVGSVSSLDDPLFSSQQGNKGLWQPYAFWEDGGTGLHFLRQI